MQLDSEFKLLTNERIAKAALLKMTTTQATTRIRRRLVWVFIIVCLICSALTFRLGWIQIVQAEELSRMARERQTMDVVIDASRGRIYDRNGNVLAMSAAAYAITARPGTIRNNRYNDEHVSMAQVNETARELARVLEMDEDVVRNLISQERSRVNIARSVQREQANMIRQLRLRGIEISPDVARYYPRGDFAAHVLGGVTDYNLAVSGIELRHNRLLSGIHGRWIMNADGTSNRISFGMERYFPAQHGYNLVLTIDEVIQHYVERTIAEVRYEVNADSVMAIVMDPQTGDILAMASYPDFDPNNPRVPLDPDRAYHVANLSESEQLSYWNQMWRNPLVSNVFEPGSTFKAITLAIALEENVINMNDRISCAGTITVAGSTLRCWRHWNPHGSQSIQETFGNSCNPAFVQIAQRIGQERFYRYLDLFGLTERTGIDLPGEALPIIQSRATVGPVGLATMSYGQGIAVTPIQLVTAVSTLGNGGRLMQPRLVQALTDSDGNIVEEFEPRVIRQVLSQETVANMSLIMEYSVASSGGRNAQVSGFRVGGKTGTANQARGGVYLDSVDASFIGMAPMDDPRVVVLVVVDNPRSVSRSGSVVAAPPAGRIMADALRHLNVQPVFTQEELNQIYQSRVPIPDVVGMNFSEARYILEAASFRYTVSPVSDSGEDFVIVDQHPRAGVRLDAGGLVFVYRE